MIKHNIYSHQASGIGKLPEVFPAHFSEHTWLVIYFSFWSSITLKLKLPIKFWHLGCQIRWFYMSKCGKGWSCQNCTHLWPKYPWKKKANAIKNCVISSSWFSNESLLASGMSAEFCLIIGNCVHYICEA